MPADFGPRVQSDGIEGLLVVADPEDACSFLHNPRLDVPWVALIVRSQRVHDNCTFDIKVSNAEAAGAVAAIVYDDVFEALIIMSRPKDHPEPGIPSVFVSQRSGIMIKRLLAPGVTTVLITPISDTLWMSMLMSVLAGVLAVSVVIATVYFYRRHHGILLPGPLTYGVLRSEEGMSAAELRKLPIVMYEEVPTSSKGSADDVQGCESVEEEGEGLGRQGGGTLQTCAVCLEDYKEGEKLRVLPCKHRFHMECIDQWLSNRKPLCPLCKHDALQPLDSPLGREAPEGGESGAASSGSSQQHLPQLEQGRARGGGLLPFLHGRFQPWRRSGGSTPSVPVPRQAADDSSYQATPQNFPGMHFARNGGDLEAGTAAQQAHPEIEAAANVDDAAESGPGGGQSGFVSNTLETPLLSQGSRRQAGHDRV